MPSSEEGSSPAKPLPRGRNTCFTVALAVIASALALAVVEMGVRVAESRARRHAVRERPVREPGPVNRLGFRDGDFATATPGREFTVLGLGDSFTWGAGVHGDSTYLAQAERRLRASGRAVEIWNGGRPGLSTFEELKLYRRVFKPLRPDAIVVGFVLNDPEDKQLRVELDRRRGPFFPRPLTGWKAVAARRWRTLEFVHGRLEATRTHREYRGYVEGLFDPQYRGWRVCEAALAELAAEGRRAGIPVTVAIWPLFTNPLDDRYPYRAIHDRVAGVCKRNGIAVVDLLDDFAGMDGSRLQVVPVEDGHPNELAHRIAADALVARVAPRWRR